MFTTGNHGIAGCGHRTVLLLTHSFMQWTSKEVWSMNHLNMSRLAPLQCRMGIYTKIDPESFTGSWNLTVLILSSELFKWVVTTATQTAFISQNVTVWSTPIISKEPQDTPWACLLSSLLSPSSRAQKAELGEPSLPKSTPLKTALFHCHSLCDNAVSWAWLSQTTVFSSSC